MKCDECFGASFNDCGRCKKMTGKEYQKLAMRTCSIPYENKEGRLHHAVFGLTSEACEALDLDMDDVMQTNIDKLKARYPEGFSADRSLHRKEGDI
jgi:hypothetical protein